MDRFVSRQNLTHSWCIYATARDVKNYREQLLFMWCLMNLSAFDDPHQFESEWESFCELKPKWLRDSGCIKKSFDGHNGEEMLTWIMEEYFS